MSASAPEAPRAPEIRTPPPRVLRRSRDDKMVAGVCGGLAHYLGVDPVLIRLAVVALALSGGVGVLLYIVAAIVLPVEDGTAGPPVPRRSNGGGLLAGIVLVLLGLFLLLRQITPWPDASIGWPAVVVAVGVVILVTARRQP